MSRSFRELLEDAGYETRSYSGRGMYGYGKTCLGVTIGGGTGGSLIGMMIADVIEETAGDHDEVAIVVQAIREMNQDSMGLGTIVYFPGTPCEAA